MAVTKGLSHNVPLERVGVLELVDQHHPVPFAEPLAGDWPPFAVFESVRQADQEVVVSEEVGVEQAAPDFRTSGGAQTTSEPARRSVAWVRARLEWRVGGPDGGQARFERLPPAERR